MHTKTKTYLPVSRGYRKRNSERTQERVFEPFFRVDKSRSRELGGVGLGLALVHEIVRVHDGSISIKSNPAGGTIFEVIFDQKSKE